MLKTLYNTIDGDDHILSILIGILLLVVVGVFSAYEYALLNLNLSKINELADEGNKKALLILKIIDEPNKQLVGIQFGKTLATLSVSLVVLKEFWGNPFHLFLGLLGMTYVTLMLGEFIPKHLVVKKTNEIALLLVGPLNQLTLIFKPGAVLLDFLAHLTLKLPGLNSLDDNVTEEEIRMIVDAGAENGSIAEEEIEMINNVFEFNDKPVGEIAIHRKDMVAIPIDATNEIIADTLVKDKFSRIPVFDGNVDNIVGILHVKDLIKFFCNSGFSMTEFPLMTLMRKPYFVPFSKKTDEVFNEMKQNKTQIAIVFDEYGGTIGLVTMEDLIEEIMGNISDEYDEEEEPEIKEIAPNAYEISGAASLEEVAEALDVKLPCDEYDTLSGFIIAKLGRIPEKEQKSTVEHNNVLFKVFSVEEKCIASVVACKLDI